MEYVGIESIKKSYRDVLQEKGDYEGAAELETKDFSEPIFNGLQVHPEDEPDIKKINDSLQKIGVDLVALDSQFASMAEQYNDLMNDVLTSLDAVDEIIMMEQERIQDMNIILGKLDEFSSVRSLKYTDFSGDASVFDENTFTTQATTRNSVVLTVADVGGNGYEGNKYVYNNDHFEQSSIDTSNHDYMIDESSTSYYEYCRITMTDKQKDYPRDVNFDSAEAECVITFYSDTQFNTIRLQSNIDTVEITQIAVSEDDGVTYKDTINKSVQINSSESKYDDDSYIYGAGVLCFPRTNYLKVYLKSNGALDDVLAFTKLMLNEDVIVNVNMSFDTEEYIYDYLEPVIRYHRMKDSRIINIPESIIIAVALAMTGVKPREIGMYNYWGLSYDSALTKQREDNGKCAFASHDKALSAIVDLLQRPSFAAVMKNVKHSSPDSVKDSALEGILNILMPNDETGLMYSLAKRYTDKYNLRQFDDGNVRTMVNKPVVKKFEQYFRRYDSIINGYEQALDDAEDIVKLDTAVRHVIRLNNVVGFANEYNSSSYMYTEELLTGPVQSIAIFANEYIPPTFPTGVDGEDVGGTEPFISYHLGINGKDFEVVPVNSHKSGVKVIRYSNYSITDDYTLHIPEPIKSAKLTIKINTPDTSYSPYVSNIKVCIGKAVTK